MAEISSFVFTQQTEIRLQTFENLAVTRKFVYKSVILVTNTRLNHFFNRHLFHIHFSKDIFRNLFVESKAKNMLVSMGLRQ